MIWTLIKKDARMLRNFMLWATVGMLIVYALYTFVGLTSLQRHNPYYVTGMIIYTLSGGSGAGLVVTCVFASLLAGSVITIERSDRSCEFLACLPPTATQNLVSKVFVVLTAIAVMLLVNVVAVLVSKQLLLSVGEHGPGGPSPLNSDTIWLFLCANVAIVGAAFAASGWAKSNGIAVLCGFLAPIAIGLSLATFNSFATEPMRPELMMILFKTISLTLGGISFAAGCYWYLTRRER